MEVIMIEEICQCTGLTHGVIKFDNANLWVIRDIVHTEANPCCEICHGTGIKFVIEKF